jgi:hypothetical protein
MVTREEARASGMASPSPTTALLARVRAFCFPNGEESARGVRAIEATERGEMRSSARSKWLAFTAEETIEACRSGFRWEARYQGGAMGWVRITEGYEDGRGRLSLRLGGMIPVKRAQGPEYDKGELQRYLASIMLCPPILLNHPSLEWTAIDAQTLRVSDRNDPTGATVDFEVDGDGRPVRCRTVRPMTVGKRTIATPWLGTCLDYGDCEGFRVARRIEASWEPPEGPFCYFRSETTSSLVLM